MEDDYSFSNPMVGAREEGEAIGLGGRGVALICHRIVTDRLLNRPDGCRGRHRIIEFPAGSCIIRPFSRRPSAAI